MSVGPDVESIRIAPAGVLSLDHACGQPACGNETYVSADGMIEVVWEWDGETFRLDARGPASVALDIALPLRTATAYVNGASIWASDAYQDNAVGVGSVEASPTGLILTCPTGGVYHILARLLPITPM